MRIPERVRYQSVMTGILAGDDADVVGESDRGERRDHRLRRSAGFADFEQMSGLIFLRVVVAKSVERYQYDVGALRRRLPQRE